MTGTRGLSAAKRAKKDEFYTLLAHDYLSGVCNRQDYLETAIRWISKGDTEGYMAKRRRPERRRALDLLPVRHLVGQGRVPALPARDEGRRVGRTLRQAPCERLRRGRDGTARQGLMADSDVAKKSGIYAYVFDGDERHLQLRAFDGNTRREVYERQKGVCAICGKRFAFEEMEADHVTPWAEGGHTVAANCQMLCRTCNRRKSDKRTGTRGF